MRNIQHGGCIKVCNIVKWANRGILSGRDDDILAPVNQSYTSQSWAVVSSGMRKKADRVCYAALWCSISSSFKRSVWEEACCSLHPPWLVVVGWEKAKMNKFVGKNWEEKKSRVKYTCSFSILKKNWSLGLVWDCCQDGCRVNWRRVLSACPLAIW